jgi:myosin heavy subunit
MSKITEESIVDNLKKRYMADLIYVGLLRVHRRSFAV